MPNLSLGTIEVLGLPAAVEAADVALKSADVSLIGYETTDGMGMVAVKIEGQVAAVQSAVAAACAAASRISKVFATSVIARPSVQLDPVVRTDVTVGLEPPAAEPAVEPPTPPLPEEPLPQPLPEGPPTAPPVEPLTQPLPEEPVRNALRDAPLRKLSDAPQDPPASRRVETPPTQPLVEPVETPEPAKPRTRKPPTTRTKK